MSFWKPKGKSSATKTATMIDAWSADIQRAADGFKAAADLYRLGDIDAARNYAHGAMTVMRMVATSYNTKHGKEDVRT